MIKEKLDDRKKLVLYFLSKCNEFSLAEINKLKKNKAFVSAKELEQEKIKNWQVYLDYNHYAMQEIKEGQLDQWFKDYKV